MLRRLFLVFLPSFYLPVSFANEASWNCQQDKNSKEWVCVGDKKPASKTAESPPPEQPEAIKNARPALSKPVDTQPAPAEPEQIEKSAVSEAEENIPAKRPYPVQDSSPGEAAPQAETRRPGWNCNVDEENKGWNCNLSGTDPKGEARIVGTDEAGFSLLNPAFDYEQERTFSTLKSRLKYDPWENCTIQLGTRPVFVPGKDLRNVSPLDVKSDYSEIFENEIGSYYGNVQISRADQSSSSDIANYDSVSETLNLQGNVYYSEDELSLYSEAATLKLTSDEARLRNTIFIAPATPLRGRAKAAYRDSKALSRYKDVAYTSCQPGNQDWVVHASELKLNKTTGKGAAKNAWLEFKGLPVFYSPYLSFPTDDRRLSGFLAPAFGTTRTGGFNFSAPYYWNIAPNFDATLKPRYFTKRGIMLGGNFRYLTEHFRGIISGEYLPNDELRKKPRFLASSKNNSVFTPELSLNWDLNFVSDKDYFAELGNALSFPNFSFIRSTADFNYIRPGIAFVSRLENYQTVDPALSGRQIPYRRLPQFNLNLNHSFSFMPLDTAMENELVYFQHNNDLPTGQRLNVKPSFSFPLKTASAFLTPKASLQYTQYLLQNQVAGRPDNISRALPILSVDSGLYLERDINLAGKSMLHTLEPRLFYLYIPKKDQSDIPIFDTALYDFWYSSLFRENRFSGTDRVQDANQVTVALTSRLQDPATGRERLRLNIGEILYFRDREVTAPVITVSKNGKYLEGPVETSTLSPLVSELYAQLTDHVSMETGLQWDPDQNDIVRGKAVLHFINQPDEIINVGYLYRKNNLIENTLNSNNIPLNDPLRDTSFIRSNDIIQTDVSFRWPIYNNWYAVGRWQYSLLYNTTQDSFIGLEKENCCWRFRVIGRRYINSIINNNLINTTSDLNSLNTTVSGTSQTGVFFQIELKGLTGIGEKLDRFFEQSIYGYRKPQQ
ncbi:LPS-assembly protein LptD [Candidatus Methylobacter favarea]|uniref:LPS-assembly protein LptD n=1 Tax=Candidatus Methylobacter favarea TaxID=2707345 RepID=A0A8S0XA17_9GAMM|nr:LPS assembly protein LptD [Candidatus Methylobacter favarea]CAA9892926.1 LPS-assembly protein LptD [Candidatus Methylobacter favarea]